MHGLWKSGGNTGLKRSWCAIREPQKSSPASTLIIAAGTEATEQIIHERISYFGDANPAFRGSVVQAIASVKDGIDDFEAALKSREILPKQGTLSPSLLEDIAEVSGLLELKIKNPLIAAKAKLGQYVKFDPGSTKPMALRIGRIEGERFYVYLYKKLDLKIGAEICVIGTLGMMILIFKASYTKSPCPFQGAGCGHFAQAGRDVF